MLDAGGEELSKKSVQPGAIWVGGRRGTAQRQRLGETDPETQRRLSTTL